MSHIQQGNETEKVVKPMNKLVLVPGSEPVNHQSNDFRGEEQFRSMVSCVKDYAIFMFDLQGRVRTWNEGAKNIKGYKADEIIGQHISVFYTKEDIEKGVIEENLEKTRALGSFEDKGWRVRKDGSTFWASVVFTACYNKQHELTGYTKVTRDISDQKKEENNLVELVLKQADLMQSSYERLVFHIENTPLGFIEWDNSFHIKALSKRAEEIFGWSLQELLSQEKTGISQVYEEDRERLFELGQELLSGKVERNNVQHRNYTKDGRIIWCDWFNSVLKDKDGKVIAVMSMVQDITDRKENEEKLLRSESRFKDAQKMAHVGNWEIELSTGNATWSEEALRIYGFPLEDKKQTKETWLSMIHPEDVQYVKRISREAEATLSNSAFFHRIIRKDGTIRQLFSCSQFQFDSDGKPVSMYGVAHDVTEMQEAEDALKQSESNYRQIVETAQEGIWLIDASNKTTFVNQKMAEIFQYSQQEMLGKDLYCFMDIIVKEAGLGTMEGRKEGISRNFDFCFMTGSQKPIWTNISVNSILDKNGIYDGALAMVSDVTEKKKLQQQLLDEQIDRQREITKAVINAQEKERAEIGEELHDNVNQLLAASKLYFDHSLSEADYSPFVVKGLEYVEDAIKEIRKLSHALVGPNHGMTIGLIDTIGELINNLSILRDIKIEFSHSDYHEVDTEAGLKLVIYRIIQEQLNNILKHAEASEVGIELRKDADVLIVNITDNGKGFNISANSGGIGLKNIRNRAEVYNGTVEILSSPGNGCKMKIVFPVA